MFPVRNAALLTLIILTALASSACGDKSKEAAESTAASAETKPAPAAAEKPAPKLTADELVKQGFKKLDFKALPKDFPEAMAIARKSQKWWPRRKAQKDGAVKGADPRENLKLRMNRGLLDEVFEGGSSFLLRWQLPEGNFRYMYDWMTGTWVEDDHQVRQAGSLWGLATCYRHKPTPELKKAIDRGLKFWFDRTIKGPGENTLTLKYPGAETIHSGSVALVALTIIEYLKTDKPMNRAYRDELSTKLDGYLAFLQWMQRKDGRFSKDFNHTTGKKRKRSSPYYDGETLLALCKAARQLDRKYLIPTIEKAARRTSEVYTIRAWKKDRDSNRTKGFYQWGSMAFAEYYQAQWKDYELYGDIALTLGWWMIHTHKTLTRNRNHAYAVEGLIAAWRIANMRGDIKAQNDLLYSIDKSLNKLSRWQIGGPLASKNKFLVANPTKDPMAQGGIMNARKPSGAPVKKDVSHQLRIDVTQHQMHAVTMALEHIYKK
ncbi:MAG TPA: hypothetical protein DIU15_07265 [Deltaproteobacteria bacterium]|nr:hypothetical protein [Deltaproteobacteria bacterium]